MSHPASVEYARFFTRYNYDAKRWSPERKQVQRAGPTDHMNDSFRSLRACNLSNKWDPLRMSANIAEQVDTRHPGTNHHIKFGYKCENDLIGLSGAKHMSKVKHLFSGKNLSSGTPSTSSDLKRSKSSNLLSLPMGHVSSFNRASSPLRTPRLKRFQDGVSGASVLARA